MEPENWRIIEISNTLCKEKSCSDRTYIWKERNQFKLGPGNTAKYI